MTRDLSLSAMGQPGPGSVAANTYEVAAMR